MAASHARPLANSARVASARLATRPDEAAVAAAREAWEADAIEPVVSPRNSFYASAASSTSTDSDASQCGGPRRALGRRFRGLRVSIRRRKSRPLQLRVPHLLSHSPAPPHQPFAVPTEYTRASMARRTSSVSHPRSAARSDWRLSHDPSVGSATPWSDASHRSFDLADLECPSEDPQDESQSRRSKAWSKLKSVRFARLKREKKAKVMFSISFYPWKMDAKSYYSNPEAAAEWVPDTASSRCQICLTAFNLARRRHHCRLCGHLVCNDCSPQRTFLPFAEDARRRSNHSLIKSGEAQRTCNSCAKTLKNMIAQQDHRVKEFAVDVLPTPSGDEGRASYASGRSSKVGRASHSSVDTVSPEMQLQLVRPRAISKASLARNDELDQVLKARAKSRVGRTAAQQHIISSQWLEQWLQFVQADSSDSVSQQTRPSMASRSSMSSRRGGRRYVAGRRPGPIANYALLDFVHGKLLPREGLRRSRGTEGTGDYHVISHDVWLVFLRLYGGGPCIVIDESASPENSRDSDNLHQTLVLAGASFSEGDFGSPRPLKWIVTELDDAVSASRFAASEPDAMKKKSSSRVNLADAESLTIRSTAPSLFDGAKSSSARPASTTALHSPQRPLALTRSISENPRVGASTGHHERRSSSSFIGYFKKWRHGDDGVHHQSMSSTTISRVSDDGVVLYTPSKPQEDDDEDDEGDDDEFASSRGPRHQRDTVAAVSAFANAAAEARRKSTMSLLRHSSTSLASRTSAMSA